MDLETELYDIERGFWLEGKAHYLAHVDRRCLLAFPQAGEMHGIHSRDEVAATATAANRWRDLTMSDRHRLNSGDDFAVISYRADVTRADGEPYAALVSSAYARHPDGWKLIFHQHSPTDTKPGSV
jgi:ketosteroid isomerase-like protein